MAEKTELKVLQVSAETARLFEKYGIISLEIPSRFNFKTGEIIRCQCGESYWTAMIFVGAKINVIDPENDSELVLGHACSLSKIPENQKKENNDAFLC